MTRQPTPSLESAVIVIYDCVREGESSAIRS